MKHNKEERQLTRAEMEIMSILWDSGMGMTTHEIIEHYPEPKPAYSTIATFLKILVNKKFIGSRKQEGAQLFFQVSVLIKTQSVLRLFTLYSTL